MAHRLTARFARDTDGTGELFAEVRAGAFGGAGSAWFSEQELVAFADKLANTYPLASSDFVTIAGGYWSSGQPGVLEQRHVLLEVYPIGPLGSLGCRVELARPRQGPESATRRVEVELVTSYEPIRQFARALVEVVHGRAREAVLEGHGC